MAETKLSKTFDQTGLCCGTTGLSAAVALELGYLNSFQANRWII
jgi:hypothetical protein